MLHNARPHGLLGSVTSLSIFEVSPCPPTLFATRTGYQTLVASRSSMLHLQGIKILTRCEIERCVQAAPIISYYIILIMIID